MISENNFFNLKYFNRKIDLLNQHPPNYPILCDKTLHLYINSFLLNFCKLVLLNYLKFMKHNKKIWQSAAFKMKLISFLLSFVLCCSKRFRLFCEKLPSIHQPAVATLMLSSCFPDKFTKCCSYDHLSHNLMSNPANFTVLIL